MEPLRLYWRPGAASMAPHAALAEIGIDYELVLLERDEAQNDLAYRALNPLGVVPTLVDGDLVLTADVCASRRAAHVRGRGLELPEWAT